MSKIPKAKSRTNNLRTLKLFLGENLRYKGLFAVTLFSWTSGMLIQKLGLPLIVADVINKITTSPSTEALSWGMFVGPFLLFLAAILISQALIDTGLVLLSRLETRVMPKLHDRIYEKLVTQSMDFHNNSFSGALVNQTNRFVGAYVGITDTFVMNFTQIIIFVFFSSVILFFYSPIIAITLFVWATIFVYINVHLTRKRMPLSRERAAADSKLTGYLADSVSNISAIKTFSAEKFEQKAYGRLATERANKGYRYWMLAIRNDAIYGLLMGLLQMLILAVSIFAIMNNALPIGTFLLAQVYVVQVIAYLWGLSHVTKNVEQNLSDSAEMTELLETTPAILDPENPETAKITDGAIELQNVSFAHADNSKGLFSDLSLSVRPGEKIGLVGHSGSGKTTFTKLLLRFNDLDSGVISIDGQDISKLRQADLRKFISYVPQEPLLFHRSLAENISYGDPEASQKQIEKVAKMAHAHEFIRDLPHGYETLVGERGVKLSGGQRQRVAIARAMLKNAPILVLDEATSALDSESEILIQDALWKLMEGRTAIVIAHRLSTIQKMDRIIVMDNGKIIEQGSHKELINHKGIYAELWNHQSGGFIDE